MKTTIKPFSLLVYFILFSFTGCQKDENNGPNQKNSICPEIAMSNYEEAALMINEYLKVQQFNDKVNKRDKLINYLDNCDCIDTINISSTIIYTYPSVQEFSIRFIINRDTINKVLDVYLYNDSKLEIHKFHN
jgi:hypothetical protein